MPNIPILMYHSVPASRGSLSDDLEVPAPDFKAQVEALRDAGYQAVLPRELVLALDGRMELPPRSVVFTFDDALQSVYDQAFPILARTGYRAAVYAVAAQIGGHNAWDDGKGLRREECMGEDALKTLQTAGWEIGSHGMHHANLTELKGEALWEEVAGSKASLEARFGRVDSFCFPYATYSPQARQAVADAGYTNAAAHRVRSRWVTADRFLLKRVYIKGREGLADFRRKISPLNLAYRGLTLS